MYFDCGPDKDCADLIFSHKQFSCAETLRKKKKKILAQRRRGAEKEAKKGSSVFLRLLPIVFPLRSRRLCATPPCFCVSFLIIFLCGLSVSARLVSWPDARCGPLAISLRIPS